jgi:hypothetical protein
MLRRGSIMLCGRPCMRSYFECELGNSKEMNVTAMKTIRGNIRAEE